MVDVEHAMACRAEVLKHARSHGVDRHHVDRAIDKQDMAIRTSLIGNTAGKIEWAKMDR
ncbi:MULTISPECIES: hypothetical protein [unclassified Rhizobium]|uniref:hypothetical protein n=1 Tax=unclassified Rhizobium TaxID=2613769 RepID=UPI001ADADA2B|nr:MULTISPECIES: hypothetical protein [unclassified Rhizobium]QYA04230.1 hypothetical protein J5278_18610 [Rhizobium sp. B21/90]MBO9101045.1 hypothetical protein [Rhizobium sp. L58/93]MBO9171621.1 hypothetical protein [Rhizobium sp. L245/93]QXZ85989.1 hypothetical protein J5287_23050 [Rhizobium sp. K1/93]QXZ92553.1 hypothetical protein J5280_26140 [Rhizobium sp. K15/93]